MDFMCYADNDKLNVPAGNMGTPVMGAAQHSLISFKATGENLKFDTVTYG